MTGKVVLAHVSDTHVGFSQYPKKATTGRGQREEDFVRAFASVVKDINEFDPPLVVHSGDFYDRPVVSLRHQKQGQVGIASLARRKDGSPRIVLVISGNHDQPSDPREPCALELNSLIPGVFIVTSRYQQIDLGPLVEAGQADPSLADVVLHALPHDVLRTCDFEEIIPVPGKTNILVSHGVVGGSDLYRRTIGREYTLPTDVVTRDWDYVAMGHWHKRGPVAVGGMSERTTPVWYAGSTENNGFADLTDGNGRGRGYLQVEVTPGQVPKVSGVDLPIRAMFKMPPLDLTGMGPEDIGKLLIRTVSESDCAGAVVAQPVSGVTREIWSLVDLPAVRSAAAASVWYEAKPTFTQPADAAKEEEGSDLDSVLTKTLETELKDDPDLVPVTTLCRQLLAEALDATSEDEESQS